MSDINKDKRIKIFYNIYSIYYQRIQRLVRPKVLTAVLADVPYKN